MVKWGDVSTFSFLCSGGPVAGPSDGPGGVHKAESVKNDWNHPRLPSILITVASCANLVVEARALKVYAKTRTPSQNWF